MNLAANSEIKHFVLTIRVALEPPLEVEDEDEPGEKAVGYYRVYGTNGISLNDAKSKVARDVSDGQIDGQIDWEDSSSRQIEPDNLNNIMRNAFDKADPLCDIWYRGGRIFYTEEP